MQRVKLGIAVLLSLCCATSNAQVTGGRFAFEFLRMSNSPHVSAMGGISVANPANDISLALQNPAMMRAGLHNQLQLNYNGYYAGVSVMNMAYGYHAEKINTSFALGVQYFNYGTFTQTDNIGNTYGEFRANDYAITLGASRSYLEHWRYGANVKWAQSSLGPVNAAAVLVDAGVNYYDTASLLDIGIVAKNMGLMVNKYTTSNPAEPMPFDLQVGISKQLKHVPIKVFTTIHHLYTWDIRHDDPALATTSILGTTDSNTKEKTYFFDKLFRHFIFGAEITLAKKVTITASYNFLRRKELAQESLPGITGFSFGAGLNLNKFQVHYGRTYYHVAGPYNEIGITMALNKLFGLGHTGERINWCKIYEDWQ
jgi:hypothetical protein